MSIAEHGAGSEPTYEGLKLPVGVALRGLVDPFGAYLRGFETRRAEFESSLEL